MANPGKEWIPDQTEIPGIPGGGRNRLWVSIIIQNCVVHLLILHIPIMSFFIPMLCCRHLFYRSFVTITRLLSADLTCLYIIMFHT